MEIEKSRSGLYTVTFINRKGMSIPEIERKFSIVGQICSVECKLNRIFIRYKEKDEALKALSAFGKLLGLSPAKNSNSRCTKVESADSYSLEDKKNQPILSPINNSLQNKEIIKTGSKIFNLILGNLPKNYTIKNVNSLVQEAKPLFIDELDETKMFNLKFCQVSLDSYESLCYLVNKLDGFVICGRKLIALDLEKLLMWRNLKIKTLVD